MVRVDTDEVARATAFRLELILMRQDHQDPFTPSTIVDQQIRKVARRYKVETWKIRGLVEEVWKDDVGHGKLSCNVCGKPYAGHPLGHCPDLDGEPVFLDPQHPRTVARRKIRARSRDKQSIPARGRA